MKKFFSILVLSLFVGSSLYSAAPRSDEPSTEKRLINFTGEDFSKLFEFLAKELEKKKQGDTCKYTSLNDKGSQPILVIYTTSGYLPAFQRCCNGWELVNPQSTRVLKRQNTATTSLLDAIYKAHKQEIERLERIAAAQRRLEEQQQARQRRLGEEQLAKQRREEKEALFKVSDEIPEVLEKIKLEITKVSQNMQEQDASFKGRLQELNSREEYLFGKLHELTLELDSARVKLRIFYACNGFNTATAKEELDVDHLSIDIGVLKEEQVMVKDCTKKIELELREISGKIDVLNRACDILNMLIHSIGKSARISLDLIKDIRTALEFSGCTQILENFDNCISRVNAQIDKLMRERDLEQAILLSLGEYHELGEEFVELYKKSGNLGFSDILAIKSKLEGQEMVLDSALISLKKSLAMPVSSSFAHTVNSYAPAASSYAPVSSSWQGSPRSSKSGPIPVSDLPERPLSRVASLILMDLKDLKDKNCAYEGNLKKSIQSIKSSLEEKSSRTLMSSYDHGTFKSPPTARNTEIQIQQGEYILNVTLGIRGLRINALLGPLVTSPITYEFHDRTSQNVIEMFGLGSRDIRHIFSDLIEQNFFNYGVRFRTNEDLEVVTNTLASDSIAGGPNGIVLHTRDQNAIIFEGSIFDTKNKIILNGYFVYLTKSLGGKRVCFHRFFHLKKN